MGNVLSSVDGNQFDIDYYQALSYRGLDETDFWINNIQGTANESIIKSFQDQLLNGRQSCK